MKRVCLITGVTRGLGLELARQYTCHGWQVIGLARDEDRLRKLKNNNVLHDYFVCDLASEIDIDQFIASFERRYSHLDKLILNAGVQHQYDVTETGGYYAVLRNEMQVNFLAAVKITSALLPMLINGKGHIIGISSLLQLGPKPMAPGYCASKSALSNWLRNLRFQTKSSGVSVTEAIPGLIKTGMTEQARVKGIEPKRLAETIYRQNKQEIIILPGARLAWFISRFWPGFIQKKMLSG